MPHKKKKLFSKHNSVKYLLVHGHNDAVNADGETLENVLVPVSNNYKPGTSLLLSGIATLCNTNATEGPSAEPNLERIMDQFEDSESDDNEDGMNKLSSNIKKLSVDERLKSSKILQVEELDYSDDSNDFYDVDSQFSDASEDSFLGSSKHSKPVDYGDCPENLKILNERFEKVLEEYDEDQIGALDDEEICGNLSTDCKRVQNLFESELNHEEELTVLGPCDEDMKDKILYLVENPKEEKIVEIVTVKPLEFDCESILSTYSNKYNHPTVIKEERVVKKIRIPNNLMKRGITKSQLKTLESESESNEESEDNASICTAFNARVKGETPEERRERKKLFKEAKRESRILKKENKLAFKREKKLQIAQNINKQHNSGIKLL